jgi:hypothetical protein
VTFADGVPLVVGETVGVPDSEGVPEVEGEAVEVGVPLGDTPRGSVPVGLALGVGVTLSVSLELALTVEVGVWE